MSQNLPIVGIVLAFCQPAFTQTLPDNTPPLRLTLQDALQRAQKYSQTTFNANIAALLAHQDSIQARAAMLPTVNGFSQFIYTQPNGTPSGVFVPNDGPHIYNDQGIAHADIWAPAKRADYYRALAAEAAARARADLATRGLIGVVVQDYYTLAVAERKARNADLAVADAQSFFDITEKQERGGEVAHSDTVKARFELTRRQAEQQEAHLAIDKARITFAVLLFPNYQSNFTVVDDLDTLANLPSFAEIQNMGSTNSPDLRAAQSTVQQQEYERRSARAEMFPALSMDYFFGISANQFATHDPEGHNLLGSVVQAQVTIPVWNWGSLRSKVRAAELKLEQARNDLSFTQRQLLSELDAFYREASMARSQLTLLREAADLARQSLDLTILRYQAGEVSVLEVVDAQTSLRDARNALDDGLARYRIALGNLQTLTGAF